MQQVLFDSSFLMAVVENPTTWFEDMVDGLGKFEPVIPECVKSELEKLARGQGRKSRWARVSLGLAAGFRTFPCGWANVDDEIMSAALSRGAWVATTDSALMRTLKSAHTRVVTLHRGRVALEWERSAQGRRLQ